MSKPTNQNIVGAPATTFETVYQRRPRYSYLNSLFAMHGSDKGFVERDTQRTFSWPPHTYADWYERQYFQFRQEVTAVFECGTGSRNESIPSNMGRRARVGASLFAWRDFFPNARVVGADVDPGAMVHDEYRIRTGVMDQTDGPSIRDFWASAASGKDQFDLMIDDGLHTHKAAITLMRWSLHRLAPAGVWVVEDVTDEQCAAMRVDLDKIAFDYTGLTWEFVRLPSPFPKVGDNNLVVLRRGL